jgi:hypothetical protein
MSTVKKRKTRIPARPETPSQPRPKAGRIRRALFADDDDNPTVQETPTKPPNKTKEKTKTKVITDAFYDPKTGLSLDPYKLYKKLKAAGHDVTIKEVESVLKNQLVDQVYKPIGKYKKKFSSIVAPSYLHNIQVDLLDMSTLAKFNKNYKWIMNGVDVFSRKAVAIPMKSKEIGSVLPAFEQMLKEFGGMPKHLNSDQESAMMGAKFQSYLKENGVTHHNYGESEKRKSGIIERFNRTVRELLVKYFYVNKTKNWIEVLPDIIEGYNTSYHTTMKETPESIATGEKESRQKVKAPYPNSLKVGDKVRMLKPYSTFDKKSTLKNWSKNLYTITEIEGQTYYIENKKGARHGKKADELQKVTEPVETKGTEGTPPEFREEKKKQQAERRLRKEDIDTDLVDDAPEKERRVAKAVPAPKAVLKPRAPPKPAEVYTVEKILDVYTRKGKQYYRIKWKGYPESQSTNELAAQVKKDLDPEVIKELLAEYKKNKT